MPTTFLNSLISITELFNILLRASTEKRQAMLPIGGLFPFSEFSHKA
jgi:hypothetical protein